MTILMVNPALVAVVVSSVAATSMVFWLVQRREAGRVTPYLLATPVVSIAPLIIIWVGDVNLSLLICAWLVAFFPILSSTILGLRSVDHNLLALFELYGAGHVGRALVQALAEPGLDQPTAVGLHVAALRETFEECGLLLGHVGAVPGLVQQVRAQTLAGAGFATALQQLGFERFTQRRLTPVWVAPTTARWPERLAAWMLATLLSVMQQVTAGTRQRPR